jgi:hypothetical protein
MIASEDRLGRFLRRMNGSDEEEDNSGSLDGLIK